MTSEQEVRLSDVGEGLVEAEIVNWLVSPGDRVARNDAIVEIETAKSTVVLPSPRDGVVARLHHELGAVVPVGAVLITIAADEPAKSAPEPGTEPASDLRAVLVGYGPAVGSAVRRRPRRPDWQPGRPAAAHRPTAPPTGYAKPPVRKLARALGVDLAGLSGSGPGGEITRADVHGGGDTARDVRIPIRGGRRSTAAAMVASAFTAPHASVSLAVDVTETVRLVGELAADPEFREVRLTPLTLITRATLLALRRHPELNATWDEPAGEIVRFHDVNLGLAVATDRGLVVPNVKRAHELGLAELARALTAVIDDARAGRLKPAQTTGGTFTIPNVGVFGVDAGAPILNPGEAAILCLGRITERPWTHRGEVRLREVAQLTVSFDHRLADGQQAANFLAALAHLLTDPARALAS